MPADKLVATQIHNCVVDSKENPTKPKPHTVSNVQRPTLSARAVANVANIWGIASAWSQPRQEKKGQGVMFPPQGAHTPVWRVAQGALCWWNVLGCFALLKVASVGG